MGIRGQYVRGAQSRSATPRALTAQHSGVPAMPGQRIERLEAGIAMVVEAPTRAAAMMVKKCIVDGWGVMCWFLALGVFGRLSICGFVTE